MDVTVAVAELEQLCMKLLTSAGASAAVAGAVVAPLVRNEQRGYRSHGLLRLRDYLAGIEKGTLDVDARPTVRQVSGQVCVVDGRRGFGVLAAAEVADRLIGMLQHGSLAAVSLVNSTHIGRPADIGERVARAGLIALGFINNFGAKERVLAWKGGPLLRTNPVLIAVPRGDEPFVLDMSTSAVAEGRLRELQLASEDAPEGWLVDQEWNHVRDPSRAFADPATAFIPPLGGPQGHKGFAMGLAVEILAGVVAGAGSQGPVGNGGLFLGLEPTLFGRSTAELADDLAVLRARVSGEHVRWPGESRGNGSGDVLVDAGVWAALQQLATQ